MIIWRFIKWRFGLSREQKKVPPYVPEYAEPDIARINAPDPNKIQLTWVGHSTFLVQVAGMNILTDPIWSERASFVSWAGPKRHARPGIRFQDLPKIDAVLLSHTHYDHHDRPTILRFKTQPRYFVPDKVKKWFEHEGIANVSELAWWKSEKFGPLTITAVPAKHWSKRWAYGVEDSGWGGFVVESPAGTIYFAGDTGWHDSYFKEIGKHFPKIDLALIPIGAYYPREVFGRFHVDPAEAIKIHQETGAKRSIGMHWGVFTLTQEPLDEPPKELARQREAAGMPSEVFDAMKLGETRVF